MEKAAVLIAILGCILFSSCEKTSATDDGTRDMSLAGSISFDHYWIKATATYDGSSLDDFYYRRSYLTIEKKSNTVVSMSCDFLWGETNLHIYIDRIPVFGEPNNAAFDYNSEYVYVEYNDIAGYDASNVSVKGWIREALYKPNMTTAATRNIYRPRYTCEIEIECTIGGKLFNMVITKIEPRGSIM